MQENRMDSVYRLLITAYSRHLIAAIVLAIRTREAAHLREARDSLLAFLGPATRSHVGLDIDLRHTLRVPMLFMVFQIAPPASVTMLLLGTTP